MSTNTNQASRVDFQHFNVLKNWAAEIKRCHQEYPDCWNDNDYRYWRVKMLLTARKSYRQGRITEIMFNIVKSKIPVNPPVRVHDAVA